MSPRRAHSPFDRLRQTFEEAPLRCDACGYVDDSSEWRVTTSGSRVRYQYCCPTCGALDTRELRLSA
ncbi:HVO_0649 family zinc finger protein [Natronobiforma cellulositropha]|uniref:HVO_0649 family zinc finger protein n=1 Tax=Natronobiforma cellulositropha TaxID=1679076 RepID=UPI0021D57E75|nr:HVO_0649 family zinc finger protein [Natronobiforma cellulositropha]